ncbi:MAG: transglutaminase domain-containing protein [Planctomycetales bacterium]|nr:transglutaminase domain-containing protein [Planctomycetales bacterium]
MRAILLLLMLLATAAGGMAAEIQDQADRSHLQWGPPQIVQLKVGLVIKATGSPLIDLTAMTPVPRDWPEQTVRQIGQEASPQVARITFVDVGSTVRRMVVHIPRLGPTETARAVVLYEVTRRALLVPRHPEDYAVPPRAGRELRPYLSGSPYIETKRSQIRKVAREAVEGVEGDWQKVEAIYDWVRDHVQYQRGPIKGAFAALRDGTGDCEELSSLFIAMCRVNNIPARTVWVPDHCYPEFYLTDSRGQGSWFPCQAAGTRAFGTIPEFRPILQKGDNFRLPELPKPQRYVAEYLQIRDVPGGNNPEVSFIRDVSGDAGVARGGP